MKLKLLFTISFTLFMNNVLLSQGSHVGKEIYDWISEFPKSEKSRSILPISASLDDFTPSVINQGQTGMCVSYALSTIHTIIYARENNITDKEKIDKHRFSPSFIYYLFRNNSDDNCSYGISDDDYVVATSVFMTKFGIPYSSDVEENFYHPFSNSNNMICEKYPYNYRDLINDIHKGSDFRSQPIEICGELRTIGNQEIFVVDHDILKSELAAGNPSYLSAVFSSDFFRKEKENCTSSTVGKSDGIGHAMVIVGYDDKKQSYKIINSYGKEWGCDGYTWIKYKDLNIIDGFIASFNGSESRKSNKDDISEFLEIIEDHKNKNFTFRENNEIVEPVVKNNENNDQAKQFLDNCLDIFMKSSKDMFQNKEILEEFCTCYCSLLYLQNSINKQIGTEITEEEISEIYEFCRENISD